MAELNVSQFAVQLAKIFGEKSIAYGSGAATLEQCSAAARDLITYIANLERRAAIGAELVEAIRFAPNGIRAIQTIANWDQHQKEHPL